MRRAFIPTAAAITFVAVFVMTPPGGGGGSSGPASELREAPSSDVYYPGCNAARAAGAAPIYRGQPGYREEMDGDGDGIACEPHRNLGW